MTRDEILTLAREAGVMPLDHFYVTDVFLQRFVHLVEQRMIRDGYRKCAEGQRTTQFCGLLDAAVKAEREACAKVCEEQLTYFTPISCPDKISGCLVDHHGPVQRKKTATECAAAIRARGESRPAMRSSRSHGTLDSSCTRINSRTIRPSWRSSPNALPRPNANGSCSFSPGSTGTTHRNSGSSTGKCPAGPRRTA